MQAELFKRNAVIFMQDEMQQLLYHDALTANGYAVQDASSASDLMGKISCSTDLIFLDVDAVNEDSVKIISKKAKEAIREGSFFCVMRKIHLDFTTLRNKCRSFMFFSEAIIVGVIDNQL